MAAMCSHSLMEWLRWAPFPAPPHQEKCSSSPLKPKGREPTARGLFSFPAGDAPGFLTGCSQNCHPERRMTIFVMRSQGSAFGLVS